MLEWGGAAARPRDENFLRETGGTFENPVLCESVSQSVSESRSGRTPQKVTFREKCDFSHFDHKNDFFAKTVTFCEKCII